VNVRWLRPAIADVERLVAFALASEAKRAPFLADRLVSAANSLAQVPERGRRVGAPSNVRELIVRVLDDRYILQ
jgi:plasmid stabilization system protein ParE